VRLPGRAIVAPRPRAYVRPVAAPLSVPRVTVWYDGDCPLCRREIAVLRRLDRRGAVSFVEAHTADTCPIDRAELLARFHAQEGDGPVVTGAAAFAAMWRALPLLRPLGLAARSPAILRFLEAAYRLFLRARPSLQRLAGGRA
jgi:predicted DCC family thiol-disulfide oxidoreductase YuxK